jgi:hypothetical protein
MIDYAEGYLKLKGLVEDIWQAIMDRDMQRARELCSDATVEARMLRQQITLQDESHRQD